MSRFRKNTSKLVICVDFDGVLHFYTKFKGLDVFGDSVPGAKEGMQYLHNRGHKIILWTTRPITPKLKDWLAIREIPIDHYNENPDEVATGGDGRKPIADVYLDDRGITFNGDWASIIHTIESFEPWYKRR